jgi:hypothetical protein
LWDVKTREALGQPLTHTSKVSSVAFTPDGKTLASSSGDGQIMLWDVATRQPIGKPLTGQIEVISKIAFSPDGKTLASSGNGEISLWDVTTRSPIGEPFGLTDLEYGNPPALIFSPDGNTLVTTGCATRADGQCLAGEITLWNLKTHPPTSQRMIGHTNWVTAAAFSPDGKTLASGNSETPIVLWDVDTRQPIGQPLRSHGSSAGLVFSPDGTILASASYSNVILWDVNSEHWLEQSCQRVGRNFTRVEWERYFPNETYRKTCDQWPLEPPIVVPPPTAQCPYVYTEDPVSGKWEFDTTILYKIVDREAAQMRFLTQFNGRLLIREEEPEISYLNRLYVLAKMSDGSTRILEPDIDALKQADGDYVILHQGEEIIVSLEDYAVTGEVREWWVMAVGYYTPLYR